jgi:hypothetical protein
VLGGRLEHDRGQVELLREDLRLDPGPGTRPTGRRIAISSYLGTKGRFDDKAISEVAEQYAEQNDRDYPASREAISSGRIEPREGV